jgi:hypothetical protein
MVALLEKVKTALRVSNSALDEAEIVPLIEAAKMDLHLAGVAMLNDDDPLIARAVTVYVKWHFGYDNPEAEKFELIYESLKNKLTQAGEYNTERVTLPEAAQELGAPTGTGAAGGV